MALITSGCAPFRTDGREWLLSGDAKGCVVAWDLAERRLHSVHRTAHRAAGTTLICLPGQPVLLTGSADNSLKMWVFDGAEAGAPRLLRSRSGHSAAPTRVRYHGEAQGKLLLSGGLDQAFRAMNAHADRQAREMSQKHVLKRRRTATGDEQEEKLPPLLDMAICEAKEGRWANLLTCHVGDHYAYAWEHHNKMISKFTYCASDKLPIMSVAISSCGNFGFVGSSGGCIDRYNLQSGKHRGAYSMGDGAKFGVRAKFGEGTPAHDGAVHGLAVDRVNTVLISSGYDGLLKFWDFNSRALRQTVEINSPVTMLRLQPSRFAPRDTAFPRTSAVILPKTDAFACGAAAGCWRWSRTTS